MFLMFSYAVGVLLVFLFFLCYDDGEGVICVNNNFDPHQQQVPYVQSQAGMHPPVGYSQKSRLAAGVLGIILGSFGIHNFYLGYVSRGLIQLLGTLIGGALTCGLAAVGIWVWALIEGIFILTGKIAVDANGVFLSD